MRRIEAHSINAQGEERFTSADILEGKVLDPDWDAASQQYQVSTDLPWLYRDQYVLLETAIGRVVISHNSLEQSVGAQQGAQMRAGGYMEWSPSGMIPLALL